MTKVTPTDPQFWRALAEARRLTRAADRAIGAALEQAREGPVQDPVQAPPRASAAPSDHRRVHRPGRPPKIDSDLELEAFIRARIDHMTFEAVAEAVARHFPPQRCVRKSAIHAWWHRRGKN